MRNFVTYLCIAMLLVVGAIGLSVCADDLCSACERASSTGIARPGAMRRLALLFGFVGASAAAYARLPFALGSRHSAAALTALAGGQVLLRVSSLRI